MTTARERMKELSGLSGVSARVHFLAVTQSGGTGPGKTVFTSRMAISVETPQVTLVQHKRERAVERPATETLTTQRNRPVRINTLTREPRIDAMPGVLNLYIVQKRNYETVVRTAPNSVVTRRKHKTAVI